jgi:hypothetical protein
MAITIMGGLFVATVLTLLVVPALYALWFRVNANEVQAESPHDNTGQTFGRSPLPVAAE